MDALYYALDIYTTVLSGALAYLRDMAASPIGFIALAVIIVLGIICAQMALYAAYTGSECRKRYPHAVRECRVSSERGDATLLAILGFLLIGVFAGRLLPCAPPDSEVRLWPAVPQKAAETRRAGADSAAATEASTVHTATGPVFKTARLTTLGGTAEEAPQ